MALDPALLMEAAGFDARPVAMTAAALDLAAAAGERLAPVGQEHLDGGPRVARGALRPGEPHAAGVGASLRQSGELFRKVVQFYEALGRPIDAVEDNGPDARPGQRHRGS